MPVTAAQKAIFGRPFYQWFTKAMHSSLLTHSAPQLQSILNGLRGALAQEGCGQVRRVTHQRHPPTRVRLQRKGGQGRG